MLLDVCRECCSVVNKYYPGNCTSSNQMDLNEKCWLSRSVILIKDWTSWWMFLFFLLVSYQWSWVHPGKSGESQEAAGISPSRPSSCLFSICEQLLGCSVERVSRVTLAISAGPDIQIHRSCSVLFTRQAAKPETDPRKLYLFLLQFSCLADISH